MASKLHYVKLIRSAIRCPQSVKDSVKGLKLPNIFVFVHHQFFRSEHPLALLRDFFPFLILNFPLQYWGFDTSMMQWSTKTHQPLMVWSHAHFFQFIFMPSHHLHGLLKEWISWLQWQTIRYHEKLRSSSLTKPFTLNIYLIDCFCFFLVLWF